MNTIEINKLSKLHNSKTIFFCKTDYILEDFKIISQLDNEVIFITGNSDYAITDELVSLCPKNIKKWYCQNAISKHPVIEPLPIGLENEMVSIRTGHGIAYPHSSNIKKQLIEKIQNLKDINNNKIYANFNIHTNPQHRGSIKEVCLRTEHIIWDDPHGDLNSYYTTIANYSMVLCPAGNGIDTHRLWEMLYCNKIPIVIKLGDYKIYELYRKLPIIILHSVEQLYDIKLIEESYINCKNKISDLELLDINYWILHIQNK